MNAGMTDAAGGGPDYPDHLRLLVEDYLEGLEFGAAARVARLAEAMRYSLLAGGKRIRPVLTLAVAEGSGGRATGAAGGGRLGADPHVLAHPRRPASD